MKEGVLHGPKGLAGQLMRKHDSEAGRRAVRSRMQRVCKCHGELLTRSTDIALYLRSYFSFLASFNDPRDLTNPLSSSLACVFTRVQIRGSKNLSQDLFQPQSVP